VLHRYWLANIPARYWTLKMDKESFKGEEILLNTYNDYVKDVGQTYSDGTTICFAGNFGIGKTFTITSILKRFVEKGYSGLYVTLEDIVANLSDSASRQELLSTDLLIIDEFNGRFIAESDKAIDLFGRTIENVIRHRLQNKLPTLFASNSNDPLEKFGGEIKKALSSLFNYVKIISVLGKDFRKEESKKK
jgi:DNA replication protein DnaC